MFLLDILTKQIYFTVYIEKSKVTQKKQRVFLTKPFVFFAYFFLFYAVKQKNSNLTKNA
jgi:hypothetical protein